MLLTALQESERTVITLYYLGGMTYEEISKFLGVTEFEKRDDLFGEVPVPRLHFWIEVCPL